MRLLVNMTKMDMIWIATASLIYPEINTKKLVTRNQIELEVAKLFGASITPIMIEGHLVSWEDRQADKKEMTRGGSRNRYLFKTLNGKKPAQNGKFRLYKQIDTIFDGWDKTGPSAPVPTNIETRYQYLLEWYKGLYFNSKIMVKSAISMQCEHVKYVLSKRDRSFGIEHLFRCMLVLSPFFFPILYVRHISGRKGLLWRKKAVEYFVIFKVLIVMALLLFTNYSIWIGFFAVYLLLDTITYLLAIVLLSDIYTPPISKGRSFLLLFINYIEVNLAFALIYLCLGGIRGISNFFDAIYFSFVSFTTLGYGDMHPETWETKLAVILQLMVMILFAFLFFIKLTPEMKNSK